MLFERLSCRLVIVGENYNRWHMHQTVDEYILTKPDAVAAKLKLVRDAIRKALPKAEEVISYSMPAY